MQYNTVMLDNALNEGTQSIGSLDKVRDVVKDVHSQIINESLEFHKQITIEGQDGDRYYFSPQRRDKHDFDVHSHQQHCLDMMSSALGEKSSPFKAGDVRGEIIKNITPLIGKVEFSRDLLKIWAYTHDMGKFFEPKTPVTLPSSGRHPQFIEDPERDPHLIKRTNPVHGKIVPPMNNSENTRENEEILTEGFWEYCQKQGALSAEDLNSLKKAHSDYAVVSHQLKYSDVGIDELAKIGNLLSAILTSVDEISKSDPEKDLTETGRLQDLNSLLIKLNGQSL